MQIWWQRYFILYIALSQLFAAQENPAGLSIYFLSQSCAEGEEEEDEEGKEKTFEVPRICQNNCCAFHFVCELYSGMSLTVLSVFTQEKEMEKQKMLYQQARLHDRGAAEMVLQMISASKGRKPVNMSALVYSPSIM